MAPTSTFDETLRGKFVKMEDDLLDAAFEGPSATTEFIERLSALTQTAAHGIANRLLSGRTLALIRRVASNVTSLANNLRELEPRTKTVEAKREADLNDLFARFSLNSNTSTKRGVLTHPTRTVQRKASPHKQSRQPIDPSSSLTKHSSSETLVASEENTETYVERSAHSAQCYKWLLKNIHNPYPSSKTREKIASSCGVQVKTIDYWFTNTRRRIGWTALSKKHFRGVRPVTVDYAQRVFVSGFEDDSVPQYIVQEFLCVKADLEKISRAKMEHSRCASELVDIVGRVQVGEAQSSESQTSDPPIGSKCGLENDETSRVHLSQDANTSDIVRTSEYSPYTMESSAKKRKREIWSTHEPPQAQSLNHSSDGPLECSSRPGDTPSPRTPELGVFCPMPAPDISSMSYDDLMDYMSSGLSNAPKTTSSEGSQKRCRSDDDAGVGPTAYKRHCPQATLIDDDASCGELSPSLVFTSGGSAYNDTWLNWDFGTPPIVSIESFAQEEFVSVTNGAFDERSSEIISLQSGQPLSLYGRINRFIGFTDVTSNLSAGSTDSSPDAVHSPELLEGHTTLADWTTPLQARDSATIPAYPGSLSTINFAEDLSSTGLSQLPTEADAFPLCLGFVDFQDICTKPSVTTPTNPNPEVADVYSTLGDAVEYGALSQCTPLSNRQAKLERLMQLKGEKSRLDEETSRLERELSLPQP